MSHRRSDGNTVAAEPSWAYNEMESPDEVMQKELSAAVGALLALSNCFCSALPCLGMTSNSCATSNPGWFRHDSFGAWHKKNMVDEAASSAIPSQSIDDLDFDPDVFITNKLLSTVPFDAIGWSKRHDRSPMIFSLTHTFAIIGLERRALYELLGVPLTLSSTMPDSSMSDVEWYRLAQPHSTCLVGGPDQTSLLLLEVSFSGNRVSGFRTVISRFLYSTNGENPFLKRVVSAPAD